MGTGWKSVVVQFFLVRVSTRIPWHEIGWHVDAKNATFAFTQWIYPIDSQSKRGVLNRRINGDFFFCLYHLMWAELRFGGYGGVFWCLVCVSFVLTRAGYRFKSPKGLDLIWCTIHHSLWLIFDPVNDSHYQFCFQMEGILWKRLHVVKWMDVGQNPKVTFGCTLWRTLISRYSLWRVFNMSW